jgi:hypothetical protein
MFGKQLFIELVPSQAHGRNLRTILGTDLWPEISRSVRKMATHKCVYCGGRARHCHEKWEWIVESGLLVQRLVDLESICVDCHDTKHIGRILATKGSNEMHRLLVRAAGLNEMPHEVMDEHASLCFSAHPILSSLPLGVLDLSWLDYSQLQRFGLSHKECAEIRSAISDEPDGAEEFKEDHAGEPA